MPYEAVLEMCFLDFWTTNLIILLSWSPAFRIQMLGGHKLFLNRKLPSTHIENFFFQTGGLKYGPKIISNWNWSPLQDMKPDCWPSHQMSTWRISRKRNYGFVVQTNPKCTSKVFNVPQDFFFGFCILYVTGFVEHWSLMDFFFLSRCFRL